jgi:hypothetical protein
VSDGQSVQAFGRAGVVGSLCEGSDDTVFRGVSGALVQQE